MEQKNNLSICDLAPKYLSLCRKYMCCWIKANLFSRIPAEFFGLINMSSSGFISSGLVQVCFNLYLQGMLLMPPWPHQPYTSFLAGQSVSGSGVWEWSLRLLCCTYFCKQTGRGPVSYPQRVLGFKPLFSPKICGQGQWSVVIWNGNDVRCFPSLVVLCVSWGMTGRWVARLGHYFLSTSEVGTICMTAMQ